MPYADIPGVRLWFTDTGGDRTPVVFLHAASGTTESWVYQEPAFVEGGFRCIAYDRRNWGRSESAGPAGAPGSASDDLEALAIHLGLERFHLVATALGGIIGLDYAVEYAQRVISLTVSSTFTGVQDQSYMEVQNRLRPAEISNLPITLREVGPPYRAINREGTARWLEIEEGSRHVIPPEAAQSARSPMTYARLSTMKTPVLMLSGDADLLSPPTMMRLVADHIPGCRFATIPEAGHAAFWEQPDIWNRLVLDFIGEHER
ncbi:MAG: alpha/beta hydrolase [Chloroflexi bacterium]|nr:alpha/beta hydrolase [Chloroflexota bacterium]